MLIVGLTGNIACGKTTCANFFKKLGASIIEADEIAHKFLLEGTPEFKEILKYFGENILNSERNINRQKLAKIVFADKEKLKVLNKILHPPTIEYIKQKILKPIENKIIIIESALILETELKNLIDKLIVVKTQKQFQLARLKNKQLTEIEGKQRMAFQLPISKKIKQADYVISNTRDLKYLEDQIKKVWEKLLCLES